MATFTSDIGKMTENGSLEGFSFFTSDQFVANYQLYESRNRYFYESGKVMMPVAARDPTTGLPSVAARVVQLAQPFGYRVFSWAVERQGLKPVLPHPAPQNPLNEVLLSAVVTPHPPEVDANGSIHIYFCEGTYTYGLLVPILNGSRYIQGVGLLVDQLRMGATPYDITPADDNVYTPEDFAPLQ